MKRYITLLFLLLFTLLPAAAQKRISGRVVDAHSGEALALVNVARVGQRHGVQTDVQGRFTMQLVPGRYRISLLGYHTMEVSVSATADSLLWRLQPSQSDLSTAVVTGRKKKYSRKNNPAVDFMRKVVAAKGNNDLHRHDFFSIDRYSKMLFALNDVSERSFEDGKMKRFAFMKDHVEVCNETGRLVLPISVDETVSRLIYRRSPKSEKTIVEGTRNKGLNNFFNTGDIMTDLLQDCFTDVDIYDNDIRLLRKRFISPISDGAIGFYHFYLSDTLQIADERCIKVDFTPNNSQDVGFSGSVYVVADSTYRVRTIDLGVPYDNAVNFVETMRIIQDFVRLPSGEQVVSRDDMIVQIKALNFLPKFMVRRTTTFSNHSLSPIDDKEFRHKGTTYVRPNAQMQTDLFWTEHRADSLTATEGGLDRLMTRLTQIKGFKPVLWVVKAFVENFVETSLDPKKPSKVDIGPVNTIISQNFVEGLRLRASAQTTANLNKHLFLKGYMAYGFKDEKWKGMGEVTYSFNAKDYLPREFPVNNLTFSYANDVMSPSDKFLPTDKDNVFTSFKWTTVDHMLYYETCRLLWDKEWENGLRFSLQARYQKDSPTAALFYRPLSAGQLIGNPRFNYSRLYTYDLRMGLTYQPNTAWINTKQRRYPVNHEAPIYGLWHTVGLYNFGRKGYAFNFTEASFYKRIFVGSWGKMDVTLKGGVQWDKVPFPLLIMPAANLSYIIEDNMFSMIDNMEFLNDRYASLMWGWDLNGKIFNRIPLLRKLKWREYLGCNVLWGTLSSKNNPYHTANAGDPRLLYFPGRFHTDGSFETISHLMDKKKPYVEVMAGIHNIFKLIHVEAVYRVNYHYPGTKKWGARLMIRFAF